MRNLTVLIILFEKIFTTLVFAQVGLPDDLHCMPVLISVPLPDKIHTEYGSGIYLSDSNRLFLVTAAHVIFGNGFDLINTNATFTSFVKGKDSQDTHVLTVDLGQLNFKGLVRRHMVHDIAVVQFANLGPVDVKGQQIVYLMDGIKISGANSPLVTFSTNDFCTLFDDVQDGSDSYVLGYPVELFDGRPSEIDFSSPLVRKGVVSQKNEKIKELVIDSAVYGGNSGGPVLIRDDSHSGKIEFRLVGIVTQFVPVVTRVDSQVGITNNASVNSGYGIAEPIDFALQLMRQ